MRKENRKEDAISPVVGVMLMIVVTIVIAAVITAFATGLAGDSTTTTPMALFEVENIRMTDGNLLESFDLVHKGGDEMKLENLVVTLEPVGKGQSGIVVQRTGVEPGLNPNYQSGMTEIETWTDPSVMELMGVVEGTGYEIIEEEGTVNQLSVRGKTGEGIDISTGDRIKVGVILKSGSTTLKIYDQNLLGWGYPATYSVQKYDVPNEDGMNHMGSDVLVKWMLSDARTTGIIAKGEFIVP